jgi:hypothetical protein
MVILGVLYGIRKGLLNHFDFCNYLRGTSQEIPPKWDSVKIQILLALFFIGAIDVDKMHHYDQNDF